MQQKWREEVPTEYNKLNTKKNTRISFLFLKNKMHLKIKPALFFIFFDKKSAVNKNLLEVRRRVYN
jgi:hypothetical protein